MFFFFSVFCSCDAITWPKKYRLKGTWNIPYQRLHIPFEVHSDFGSDIQRQADKSYNGVQWNIHIQYDRVYQMQPRTQGDYVCMFSLADPTDDAIVEYLPDLSDETVWKDDGEAVALGRQCHVWVRNNVSGVENWYYKFYVDAKTLEPVRYYMHGRSIRGSHPTDYYFDIEEFAPTIDESWFIYPPECNNSDTGGPVRRIRKDQDLMKRRITHTGNTSTKCPVDESKLVGLPDVKDLPDSFSWKDVPGVLQMPRDQANCGSCWAEGSANAISAQFSLLMKGAGQASVQQIVDCTWGQINFACSGGETDDAYQMMLNRSIMIVSEADYPYTGVGGYCATWNESSSVITPLGKLTNCWQVPPEDEDTLKRVLYAIGPIAVAIKADAPDFSKWQPNDNGPYDDPLCWNLTETDLDHVVLLTGWRKYSDNVWAWEIQNSWSDTWGDKGYGYIRAGVIDGVRHDCGITFDAFVPEIELFRRE